CRPRLRAAISPRQAVAAQALFSRHAARTRGACARLPRYVYRLARGRFGRGCGDQVGRRRRRRPVLARARRGARRKRPAQLRAVPLRARADAAARGRRGVPGRSAVAQGREGIAAPRAAARGGGQARVRRAPRRHRGRAVDRGFHRARGPRLERAQHERDRLDRRGAALLHAPAARRGRLMMLGLRLAGRWIALKCNFLSGEGSFAFKIAYDEEYARFSPGTLLELENIRRFHAQPELRWMDSCADPDHFMANRLWLDRRGLADLVTTTGRAAGELMVSSLPLLHWMSRTLRRMPAATLRS